MTQSNQPPQGSIINDLRRLRAERQRQPLSVKWGTTVNGTWCPLTCDLKDLKGLEGVYVIGTIVYDVRDHIYYPRAVDVGSGNIQERLSAHRNQQNIKDYGRDYGPLFFTWATVTKSDRRGVERYLADRLEPVLMERRPDVKPIPVNLPW